ncbi:hypothetical protein MVEN_00651000 [Mycena venus]|uniref:Secreted protein n=1 Tax=Mycena venus TaxID=2733690 RepID=A0A8H7D5F9_9AGAR|nr:hypothetical protein MVEN_00651000 [Mycena venus]
MLAFLPLAFTLFFVNVVHSAPCVIRRADAFPSPVDCDRATLERDSGAHAVLIPARHEDVHRSLKSDIDQDPPDSKREADQNPPGY